LRRRQIIGLIPIWDLSHLLIFVSTYVSPIIPRITVVMDSSRIAAEAYTGFAASSDYDAHRPSYPAEAVSQLLSALNVVDVKGARIADLAAGTGKLTELLAARPENYEIIAIEPHDAMREELVKKGLQGVTVLNGTAEDMSEIADGSLDALVVAQVRLMLLNVLGKV
jgi:SAM-dependent methyltransferase